MKLTWPPLVLAATGAVLVGTAAQAARHRGDPRRPGRPGPRLRPGGMIVGSGNRGVLHQVSEHGGLLYIGGIAADDPALGMAGQTRQMLEKLDAVLRAHGSDRRHVLMMHSRTCG